MVFVLVCTRRKSCNRLMVVGGRNIQLNTHIQRHTIDGTEKGRKENETVNDIVIIYIKLLITNFNQSGIATKNKLFILKKLQ